MWSWYLRQLEKRPVLTQALMSGVLFAAGDVCAQQIVERKGLNHDFMRTARLGFFGTCVAGPAIATWYRVMDRFIRHPNAGVQTLMRVAADQALIAPTFLSGFFIINSLLDGKTWEQSKALWADKIIPTVINNYKVWPAINLINFYFVPLQHRLLVVNTIALVWNTYLAYIINNGPNSLEAMDKPISAAGNSTA